MHNCSDRPEESPLYLVPRARLAARNGGGVGPLLAQPSGFQLVNRIAGFEGIDHTKSVIEPRPVPSADPQVTLLLKRMSAGDAEAQKAVWTLMHDELRGRAKQRMGRNNGHLTIQATQLVGFAFERIARLAGKEWRDRGHFLATASTAMRCALLDYLRGRQNGEALQEHLDHIAQEVEGRVGDVIEFNEVLEQFSALDPITARAIEMRMFGFPMAEVCQATGVPERTLTRNLKHARIYLYRKLK